MSIRVNGTVVIVGGVAGGASCAARLRRLREDLRIILIDRGPHVSFANCGLPYFVGQVISDEAKLLVAKPALFRDRFNIEVRTRTEAIAIDRQARTVTFQDLDHNITETVEYDALVLSPGAAPIRPELPGIELPGIFTVRSIPDTHAIRAWIDQHQTGTALVVGGGFIGLEMAENLRHRGLKVIMLERNPQVMAPLDPEMADIVAERLQANGVQLELNRSLTGFQTAETGLIATLADGGTIATDLVILAIGVKPETRLALSAGLTIGQRGGIAVDDHQRTNDPAIWAVGDATETRNVVMGQDVVLPLAGPANRQGRIAADVIAGREARFRGVQATAICGIFGLQAACTGASEKALQKAGITDMAAVHLHPGSHASYYPGAKPVAMKLVFRPSDGRILGAQAVGEDGIDKRIDAIAMAIQLEGTIDDLAEAELCYAPQFGAAKDPVNLAGMIAQNVRNGDLPQTSWSMVGEDVLDVREPAEIAKSPFPDAVTIPLNDLRKRYLELPADRTWKVVCAAGQRASFAVRFLNQHGRQAELLPGGMATRRHLS